jgi:hypothetical protein
MRASSLLRFAATSKRDCSAKVCSGRVKATIIPSANATKDRLISSCYMTSFACKSGCRSSKAHSGEKFLIAHFTSSLAACVSRFLWGPGAWSRKIHQFTSPDNPVSWQRIPFSVLPHVKRFFKVIGQAHINNYT